MEVFAHRILILLIICTALSTQVSYAQPRHMQELLTEFRRADSIYFSPEVGDEELDRVLKTYRHILATGKTNDLHYVSAQSLLRIGMIMAIRKDYDEALRAFREGIGYCDRDDTSAYLLPSLLNNIANVYYILGDYETCMKYYDSTVAADEALPENRRKKTVYNNIGNLLTVMKEPDRALYYLAKGEVLARKGNDSELLSSTLLNKGLAFYAKGDTAGGRKALHEALTIAENIPYLKRKILTNMGHYSWRYNKLDLAKRQLHQALAIDPESNIPEHSATVKQELGYIYLLTKEYGRARQFFQEALHEATEAHDLRVVADIHGYMGKLYAATGEYALAYQHNEVYQQLSDSLDNKEKAEAVNLMEIRYRTAQKDKEIAESRLTLKSQEQKLAQKNLLIVVATSGAIILAILLIMLFRHLRNRQKLHGSKIQILEQQHQISEMKSLMRGEEKERTRIARQLHDDIMIQFSVVKMQLSTVIGNADPKTETELREILASLDSATANLRSTAHNLMPDMLLQEGLIAALDYFCDNCRTATGIEIELLTFGDTPAMDTQFELSVFRIIQELVQNVIKHAAATKIIIQLSSRNEVLHITIEDNGIGMSSKVMADKKGLGLKSIHARVLAFNGTMDIESREGEGVTVNLEFDIRNNLLANTQIFHHQRTNVS